MALRTILPIVALILCLTLMTALVVARSPRPYRVAALKKGMHGTKHLLEHCSRWRDTAAPPARWPWCHSGRTE
jgi:hypothetical protein